MLILSILLFGFAACLGIYLLTFVLQSKNTPKGITFLHGPIAGTALILLIGYALIHSPKPIISILIFIGVAFGGLVLIFRDFTGKSIPKWLAVAHGFFAFLGFLFLLLFAFSS